MSDSGGIRWSTPPARHGDSFRPTFPDPQTDDEKRQWISEARSYYRSGWFPAADAPVPEFYPGQYEDILGVQK